MLLQIACRLRMNFRREKREKAVRWFCSLPEMDARLILLSVRFANALIECFDAIFPGIAIASQNETEL
jgi:hypothetical protein